MMMMIDIFFVKNNYLILLILLPLLAIINLMFIDKNEKLLLKKRALEYSVATFLVSLCLFLYFDNYFVGFQYLLIFNWLPILNLFFLYGIDGISLFLLILTTFLIPICILSSWVNIKFKLKEFLILLFILEFLLINVFTILDLILFYIFFEAILIPMFIIIGVWGSRKRKIHAAYQFFLYTFFGSVLMLLGILFIYFNIGSTDYFIILRTDFSENIQIVLWLCFFISFAIKIPMVPVHIWLPEAHVEAPTVGSVLLAGVLLKLGSYGLIRFSIPLFPYATKYFMPLVLTMSVIGIIYSSCTTLRQIDLKKIIAYSSVAHMSLVTIGLFSNSSFGIIGGLTLMLSHGIVSSGLFLCVGIIYDRYKTRIIKYYSGLVNMMPIYSVFFLIFSLSNMGTPGTSAFIGEILIFIGAFNNNSFVVFLASLGIIFSAIYSIWLYNRITFGSIRYYFIKKYSDIDEREIFILSLLCFLIIFLGFYPSGVLNTMDISVSNILLSQNNWPIK